MRLDKTSVVPLYYQLKVLIQDGITSGAYPVGSCLPSEREFCDEYGISRMTVRQAVSDLVKDGFLRRERGKGTYIALPKIEQGLELLTSFTEDMKRRGLSPGTQLLRLSVIKANGKIAGRLGLDYGTEIYEIVRLRLADDEPMAIETAYVPVVQLPGLSEEMVASGSLYEVMRRHGLQISYGEQTLESALVQAAEAVKLNVKRKTPVLLIERTTYTSEGQAVEFVKSVYRSDRYKFAIHLNI